MKRKLYNEALVRIERLEKQINGGKGSGNFGHAGREGKVGGSAPAGSDKVSEEKIKELEEAVERAKRAVWDTESDLAAEEDFGGDTSHLESVLAEEEEELRQAQVALAKAKSQQDKKDTYTPGVFTGLKEKGDSFRMSAKEGIKVLDESRKDLIELAKRQYDEQTAKTLEKEIDRVREGLSMLEDDWRVDVRRVSPKMLEAKFLSRYKIGDTFTLDGEEMHVVEGDKPGTIMGRSKDGKKVAQVPDERLFQIAMTQAETNLGNHNKDTISRIAEGGNFNEKEVAKKILANIEESSKKKANSYKVSRSIYDSLMTEIEVLEKQINGGKGSGNFGHSGRPGEVGGSASGDGSGRLLRRVVSISSDSMGKPDEKEYSERSEISSPDSSLGTSKAEYDKAREKALRRGGLMVAREDDLISGTYAAKNNFYNRVFSNRREAIAFQDGYNYKLDSKDRNFTQVDYIKTTDNRGSVRYEVMYKGSDTGVDRKAVYKNPIEAQRWCEGYNSATVAIESEVPSDKWYKKTFKMD